MRELWLIRHAKSSWKQADVDDSDRPLSSRGREDAPQLGNTLAKLVAGGPDLVISSPALRALSTATALCHVLKIPDERLRTDRRLYNAAEADLLEVIHDLPASAYCVFLVGHNPSMHDLCESCSGLVIPKFGTSYAARFAGELSAWTAFLPGRLKFMGIQSPAEVESGLDR